MSIIRDDIVNQGHGILRPRYFAVHSTANVGATAQNHRDLWSRGYDSAVHLVSDWTQAIHTVPYDRLCWQVGNGNSTCEGLEICEADNYADFYRGIKIAAQVIRERLTAHGWGIDRVKSHAWFSHTYGGSDHTDPNPYFARWGYNWDAFLNEIQSGTTDSSFSSLTTNTLGEDLLMALSQYDQELVKNAVVDINNRTARIEKALGPVPGYPFNYLPAILNNLNGLYALIGKQAQPNLTDDQVDQLATSLKTGLGEQVVKTLAEKLGE